MDNASFRHLSRESCPGAPARYPEAKYHAKLPGGRRDPVTKLTANIRGDISVVLSYRIRNNSDVPVGTVKTDTFTAVALEYAF